MSVSPPTRRRWFQFSLGTMLLVITGLGCWLGLESNAVQKRRQISDWLLYHGGWLEIAESQATISFGRRLIGDHAVNVVLLDKHEELPGDITFEKIKEAFPEARVMLWSDHPVPNEWRPPNRAKEVRDKAYSEKLRAKREARKEKLKSRQAPAVTSPPVSEP